MRCVEVSVIGVRSAETESLPSEVPQPLGEFNRVGGAQKSETGHVDN